MVDSSQLKCECGHQSAAKELTGPGSRLFRSQVLILPHTLSLEELFSAHAQHTFVFPPPWQLSQTELLSLAVFKRQSGLQSLYACHTNVQSHLSMICFFSHTLTSSPAIATWTILTLSVPVVFLNSPNLSPYFSLNKFERIWLLIFSSWLWLINSNFLITKCHILYVLYKEK